MQRRSLGDPYRVLPVVRTVEASDCLECRHRWTFMDNDFRSHEGCMYRDIKAIVAAENVAMRVTIDDEHVISLPTADDAREGKCTHFERKPWLRLLQWLGLRKPKLRREVVEPPTRNLALPRVRTSQRVGKMMV